MKMTIREACDLLKSELLGSGYEYGFYLNGVKHKPDMSKGFDEAFHRALTGESRIQDPVDTMREKTGTCVDVAVLMKAMLAERGVPGKIWLLHDTRRDKFHAILTFEAEGRTVYLELTPQSRKPWYGKEILYESEADFIEAYEKNGYEVTDVTDDATIGSRPEFILSRLG